MSLPNHKTVKITGLDKVYHAFQLHWRGWTYYEPETALVLQELLREADVFLDIGANIGYYSLFAASRGQKLKIVAFEPNEKIHSVLCRNTAVNGFDIHCEKMAMSDRNGKQDFYVCSSDMSGSLDKNFRKESIVDVVRVAASTLDNYLVGTKFEGRLVIKIDAEGSEPNVIRGALNTLRYVGPDIILEVLQQYDEGIIRIFRDAGYLFYRITNSGLKPSETLTPAAEESYYFFNYLVTRRDSEETVRIFEGVRKDLDTLDWAKTSWPAANVINRDKPATAL